VLENITHATTGLTFGSLSVTPLSDGYLNIPAAYFPDLNPADREKVSPATRFGANTWLIETSGRKILVDTGSGTALRDHFPATGTLGWQAPEKTAERAAITDIVITHMHADHIGGLSHDGISLFPNAEIHVQENEWDFWTDAGLLSRLPEDRRPLAALIQALAKPIRDQVNRHSGEAGLGDGLTLLPAPGHTPGHQIVHLSSGGKEALLLADAVVSDVLQFADPDIRYALDTDPGLAAETRKSLFGRIAADGIPFAATHLNTTGFGHLTRRGSGYLFEQA